MFIDEEVFNDQMRGLLVARGGYTSEKKREEIKRYWYLEFRNCDEPAFIQVMGKLKFGGKSGEGFPSFRDFREQYNILIKPEDRLKNREFCGLCHNGTVIFRDLYQKTGEVHDYAANCSKCAPGRSDNCADLNPHDLHKDRLGYLRTFEALKVDRETGGLRPEHDPDLEITINLVPPVIDTKSNGKEIAQAIFGKNDPKTEEQREKSLKQEKRRSEFPEIPF